MDESNGLESFISELQSAKGMKVVPNDAMLIYSSMMKSGKLEMLDGLTQNQRTNLNHFIGYLRSSFGPSQHEQRLRFQRLKQGEDESCIDYFLKCEKVYFQSKNMPKPTGNDFLDQYKEDIKFQYVQGLKDPEVKRLMVLNTTAIEYSDIPNIARNYFTSLRNLDKVYLVNDVIETKERQSRSRSSHRDNSRSKSPKRH